MQLKFRSLSTEEFKDWNVDLSRRYSDSKKTALGYTEAETQMELEALLKHVLNLDVENSGQFVVAVEVDGEVVGKTWFGKNGGTTFIYDLVIEPKWRGKGIGPLVLDHIRKKAIELNTSRTMFQVFVFNADAFEIFRNYGFRIASYSMVLEN